MKKLIFLLLLFVSLFSQAQVYDYQVQAANILQADDFFIWKGDTIRKDSIVYVDNKIDSVRMHYINGNWSKWIKSTQNKVTGVSITGTSSKTFTLTQLFGGTKTAVFTDNDNQTLSTSVSGTTRTITISGGNSVSIDVADNDNNPLGEIQAPTLVGDNIGLTQTSTTISISGKEDKSNKENTTVDNNITKYPTVNLLKTYADSKVSDAAYSGAWDNVTTIAPSKNAVYDKISTLESVNYCATTMTVTFGTLNQGTVSDLCAVGGTDVIIQERVASPPFQIDFSFSGVQRISGLKFYGRYNGSPTHNVHVEAFNYVSSLWDYVGELSTTTNKQWFAYNLNLPNNYLSGGIVLVRIIHQDTGNNTHQFILDYINVNYGGGGGSGFITAGAVEFMPNGNITDTNVQAAIQRLDAIKEPVLTKGNLTESITGIQFDNTRQVIGGAADLSLTSGYGIPTTTQISDITHTNRTALNAVSGVNTGDQTLPTTLPTPNALTMNNSGTGDASGSTFNGSAAKTISYNTIGAEPAFSKNTAFNKNFGTTAGTVLEGRTFGTAANNNIGDFIQNQFSSVQEANLWVKVGRFDDVLLAYKPDSDSPLSGSQFKFGDGYIGFRAATDKSFNIDTYSDGALLTPLKITQAGAATFASTIQATTAKLTNLTDGYIPYHISDASGLGDSPMSVNGKIIYLNDATDASISRNGIQFRTSEGTIRSGIKSGNSYASNGLEIYTGNNTLNSIFHANSGLSIGNTFATTLSPSNGLIIQGNVGIGYSTGSEITNNKLAVNGKVYSSDSNTANAFIKIGGTSAQYLLADGSVTSVAGAVYKGEVNGSTGVPIAGGSALADGTGTTGWYYAASISGTHNYGSGNITLAVGDQLYYNGTIWLRIPGAGSYTLPVATASTLGGVKSSASVSIDAGGVATVSTNYEVPLTFSTGLSRSSNTITNTAPFPGFGTNHTTAAYGDHLHTGVYDNYQAWFLYANSSLFSSMNSQSSLNFIANAGLTTSASGNGTNNAITYSLDIGGLTTIGNPTTSYYLPVVSGNTSGSSQSKIQVGTLEGLLGTTTGDASRIVRRDGNGYAFAVDFKLYSDRRLKKDIKPINNLKRIDKIKFVQYKFKNDSTNRPRYGVIAQDVEKIAPELVSTDDTGMKAVGYTDLIIAKLAAMEERINNLETEVKYLRKKVKRHEK